MAADDYLSLNAMLNLFDDEGGLQVDKDKEAVEAYMSDYVHPRNHPCMSMKPATRVHHLADQGYYDPDIVAMYTSGQWEKLYEVAATVGHQFPGLLAAIKFHNQYAMTTTDGSQFLEGFVDRCVMVAATYAAGDMDMAEQYLCEILSHRYQPATPTFLNAGRVAGGQPSSCYLLHCSDNLESISRAVTDCLQLSKRGGGVAINLTDLRANGDPIQGIEGAASGVIPVMKILEDSFKYANQLGARQGAGAVYLHAHHPDILRFLDTKRENADEAVRIKTLSIGIVIPDITFHLAKNNEPMHLFSPYDVERAYGVPFSQVDVTEEYGNMVANPDISSTVIDPRKLFMTIAELQFESGYPYLMFIDNANRANPNPGAITMSNLCVTGDTMIATDKGTFPAASVNDHTGGKFQVMTDTRVGGVASCCGVVATPSSPMVKTAHNAPLFTITTFKGRTLTCTPWHKMYVIKHTTGTVEKVSCNDLNIGDYIPIQSQGHVVVDNDEQHSPWPDGWDKAIVSHWGTLAHGTDASAQDRQEWADAWTTVVQSLFQATYAQAREFLATLSSMVHTTAANCLIPTQGIPTGTVQQLRAILTSWGIGNTMTNTTLIVDSVTMDHFMGTLPQEDGVMDLCESANDRWWEDCIVNITPSGVGEVYDVTVPDNHSVIFNGIVTGNCTEIMQTQTPGTFREDGAFLQVGDDISCNLGSLNIKGVVENGDIGHTVTVATEMLTEVSSRLDVSCSPSINHRNARDHAIGLGLMNLHGFLATHHIHYDSDEARDFASSFASAMNYHSLAASCAIARRKGQWYPDFPQSTYASGEYFTTYLDTSFAPQTQAIQDIYSQYGIVIPTQEDWGHLKDEVMKHGLYNSVRLAVAPTGSISYVVGQTWSCLPVPSAIEVRKEGKIGRIYRAAPELSEDNLAYYTDAYEVGTPAIMDMYAAIQPHVDQGMSLTLFVKEAEASTRVLNKLMIHGWNRCNLKSLYYVRVRNTRVDGTDVDCVSCQV